VGWLQIPEVRYALPMTWELVRAEVAEVRMVAPRLVEVAFAPVPTVVGAGYDQRVKLFLPRAGQDEPVLPAAGPSWYPAYRAMDPDRRAVMRTYTIAGVDAEKARLLLWFVLHGDTGPASAWAARARPGDRVGLLVPAAADAGGLEYAPGPGTDGVLLAGDETALPALARITAALPAGLPARALVEVAGPADELPLPSAADLTVRWLHRDAGATLARALPTVTLPGPVPYAWVAGEAGLVRAARRHLKPLLPRAAQYLGGYWRRGRPEAD
jgi:NADPH-dependent ferric siderophore reductase